MNCLTFQDQLSDTLKAHWTRAPRLNARASAGMPRMPHAYTDVRDTMASVGELSLAADIEAPHALNARILSATTTGEMLNSDKFDVLIEPLLRRRNCLRLNSKHFKTILTLQQMPPLLLGIEDAISLCAKPRRNRESA